MSPLTDIILIPYGTGAWSADAIKVQGFSDRGITLSAPFPLAVVSKGSKAPLRLNSEVFGVAPPLDGLQGASPLDVVFGHLKGLISPWDKLLLRFLDGYRAHIGDMLHCHRDQCAAKLAPFAGLYAVEDWAFSAPKPLPSAHLFAPPERGGAWDESHFVQVDFAFWLGDRLVAVLADPGRLTPAGERGRRSRLEQAQVSVVTFCEQDLAERPTELFGRIIGDFGDLLSKAGAVPSGPFRPQGLDG